MWPWIVGGALLWYLTTRQTSSARRPAVAPQRPIVMTGTSKTTVVQKAPVPGWLATNHVTTIARVNAPSGHDVAPAPPMKTTTIGDALGWHSLPAAPQPQPYTPLPSAPAYTPSPAAPVDTTYKQPAAIGDAIGPAPAQAAPVYVDAPAPADTVN